VASQIEMTLFVIIHACSLVDAYAMYFTMDFGVLVFHTFASHELEVRIVVSLIRKFHI